MNWFRERSGKEIILTRSDSTPSNIMSALMTMKGTSGLQQPSSVNLSK